MEQYDVVVVGLGVMGAAATWSLARRGVRVLGVDANAEGHMLGSSHGKTRATRESYFESPEYVPLMKEAHTLWRGVEAEAGVDLLTMNGGAYFGPPDHPVLKGVVQAAAEHNLELEDLTPAEAMARHPGFFIPEGWQALVERTSGVLRAEECVTAFHDAARRGRAAMRFGEAMRSWRTTDDGVVIDLASGPVQAKSLVLTLGPWAVEVLAVAKLPIHGRRVTVAHFDTMKPESYANDDLGVFFWSTPIGVYGGFQHIDGQGVKLLRHDDDDSGGGACTPETIQREVTDADIRAFTDFSRIYLPDVGDVVLDAYTCIYTMTPDDHFIIDRHPGSRNVVYATGFSGHGFKFAPVVGEVLADLAQNGETDRDIGFLRASRF